MLSTRRSIRSGNSDDPFHRYPFEDGPMPNRVQTQMQLALQRRPSLTQQPRQNPRRSPIPPATWQKRASKISSEGAIALAQYIVDFDKNHEGLLDHVRLNDQSTPSSLHGKLQYALSRMFSHEPSRYRDESKIDHLIEKLQPELTSMGDLENQLNISTLTQQLRLVLVHSSASRYLLDIGASKATLLGANEDAERNRKNTKAFLEKLFDTDNSELFNQADTPQGIESLQTHIDNVIRHFWSPDPKKLAKQLQSKQTLPFVDNCQLAVVDTTPAAPTDKTQASWIVRESNDENLTCLLYQLLSAPAACDIKIANNTPIVLRIHQKQAFIQEVLCPIVEKFAAHGEVCLWPFLEAVLTQQNDEDVFKELSSESTYRECFKLLAESNIYQFLSPNTALTEHLNAALHGTAWRIKCLKAKLAALQIIQLHYVESPGHVSASFTQGITIGAGAIAEGLSQKLPFLTPPQTLSEVITSPSLYGRIFFSALYSLVDNIDREDALFKSHSRIQKPLTITAQESNTQSFLADLRKSLKRFLLLIRGTGPKPDDPSLAKAYRLAAVITAVSLPATAFSAFLLTQDESDMSMRLISTALAMMGIALLTTTHFALALPRIKACIKDNLKNGKLPAPIDIDLGNIQALENYAHQLALQETIMRINYDASTKAFFTAPLSSLGWLTELTIPRWLVQTLIVSLTTSIEGMAWLGFDKYDRASIQRSLRMLEKTLIEQISEDATTQKEEKTLNIHQLRTHFNGSIAFSEYFAQTMNWLTQFGQWLVNKHLPIGDAV